MESNFLPDDARLMRGLHASRWIAGGWADRSMARRNGRRGYTSISTRSCARTPAHPSSSRPLGVHVAYEGNALPATPRRTGRSTSARALIRQDAKASWAFELLINGRPPNGPVRVGWFTVREYPPW